MGKVYADITNDLRTWIEQQKIFFVATAPLATEGHINCSPKGMDSFRILGPRQVAYLDLTGSGVETIAHLKENGRIVVMFCGFEGPPQIVRLHGTGQVFPYGSEEFERHAPAFDGIPGARAIIHIEVDRISDSCGYGVPFFEFKGDRETLVKWAEKKGPEGLKAYQQEKNTASIDRLPGLG